MGSINNKDLYPQDSVNDKDFLIGSDFETKVTKTYSVKSIKGFLTPYTVAEMQALAASSGFYAGMEYYIVDAGTQMHDISVKAASVNTLFKICYNVSDSTKLYTYNLDTNILAQFFLAGDGSGDMLKAVYDADEDGIVDNSELLGGQNSAHYLARANHTGTQDAATVTGTKTASFISDFAATVRATVITGFTVGSNAALAATDTILAAFGKLQAQINYAISLASSALPLTSVIDEDDMASDSDTHVPTQQSVKAYVNASIVDAEGYTDSQAQDAVGGILVDTTTINFTYNIGDTPTITADLKDSSVTQSKLDDQLSSDLANAATSLQPAAIGVTIQAYSAVLAATTASFTTADESKLDGIATGAQVNTINTAVAGEPTGSDLVLNVVSLTQAEYDAGTKVATTFYIITT